MAATEFLPQQKAVIWYAVASICASATYLLLTPRPVTERTLLYILCGITAARLLMLGAQPTGSDDVYRYLWDGKVQANGINPYQYAPADTALNSLHSEQLPSLMNFQKMKTIYFPVAQYVFWGAYALAGEQVWGIKLLLLLSELLTLLFIYRLLQLLQLPRERLLLYALLPLTFFQFAVDAHIDALGVAFLAGALYYFFANRYSTAMLWLALSLLVKPSALIAVPLLLQAMPDWRQRLSAAAVLAITFTVAFIPYLGVNPFQALGTFTANWTFNGSVFQLFFSVTNNNQWARLACGVAYTAVYAILFFSGRPTLHKLYYAFVLLLLFSPVVHPWYTAWLAVFIPLVPMRSALVYCATASLAIVPVVSYRVFGVWREFLPVLLLEYLPVYWLLFRELRAARSAKPVA